MSDPIPGLQGSTRQCGDDPAGLFEIGKLERNRRAYDRILPFVRDRKAANPFHPIVSRAVSELAANSCDISFQRLIRPEHHVNGLGQDESRLPLDG